MKITKRAFVQFCKVLLFCALLIGGLAMTVVLLPVWVGACIADTLMRKFRKAGKKRRSKRTQHQPVHSKPLMEPPSDEMDY